MPIWQFLVAWLVCAVIAALCWDNLIANTQGANDFGLAARVTLAIGFGLPGAGLISFAWGIIRDQAVDRS